jgi:hypothetical protein
LAFDGGKLLVSNSKGQSVQILNADGTLFASVTNPLFNKPWSVTPVNTNGDDETLVSFFTSNKIDAKILRVDVVKQGNGAPQFNVVQVGQFPIAGDVTKVDLHWIATLKVGNQILDDVLLALDVKNNRVAAFAHSSTLQGTGTGVTVFQGTPLNVPGGLAVSPFNNDLLIVNLNDNNLVEIDPATAKVVGVKQIDPTFVDAQGNNSALFGVAATTDVDGSLLVYFTDDNTNTLNVLARAVEPDNDDRIRTINGLLKISQVGSTENILDLTGKKVTVDPNPYKIAIAPANSGTLKKNDVLVSNIGNVDHGTTIVDFAQGQGTGRQFNAAAAGVMGPGGLAFDNGKLLVGNSTANDVLILNSDGTLFATVKDALFNGPWGVTPGKPVFFGGNGTVFGFFVTNKFDGKLLRVDVTAQGTSLPKFTVVQVGQFDKNGATTKIDVRWLQELRVGNQNLKDVLVATDPANSRVAAFANSSTLTGTGAGVTLYKGAPLNQPGGLAINPFNLDLLVVNLMDNNLVELNATLGQVVGLKQIDPAIVDAQGNNSALFGVAASQDAKGNLIVYFTNDNTNTLNLLSAADEK